MRSVAAMGAGMRHDARKAGGSVPGAANRRGRVLVGTYLKRGLLRSDSGLE